MDLKLGIIGTNFISGQLADAVRQVPGISLHAVFSRKRETGNAFAQKFEIPHIYTDYDAFLRSDINAVYVASPNYAHFGQTIRALEQGRHVLCEKVMALDEGQVRSMAGCARRNGVILLEAMRPDFDPAFRLAEETLPLLGTVRRAVFEFCQYSSRYDKFLEGTVLNAFNPELGNAAVMDIGVYCIRSAVRFFGMPQAIKAFSTKLSNGFEGSGTVLMKYGDDMTAEAVYSKITTSVTPSVIQGEKGSLLIDGLNSTRSLELRLRTGSRDPLDGGTCTRLPYTPAENNMIYEVEAFLRLIRRKEVNHQYLRYTLDTIRVIDEVKKQTGIRF